MEPLFRGPLGPMLLERLAQIQATHQRLDREAGDLIGVVAEAHGHRVEPGRVRLAYDLAAKEYVGMPVASPAGGQPPAQLVPPAAPADEERSA